MEIFGLVTSPLKHSPQERLGVSAPGINAINQLIRLDGEWSGTSTDGPSLCRSETYGINPKRIQF